MSSADGRLASGPSSELGRVLTRLRNERGLVQKQVAHLAAIDGSTLSRLESGDRGVSREVLDRICGVLRLNRHERLEVLVAAGFLNEDTAHLLADDDIAKIARLMHGPALQPDDEQVIRQYLRLALAHARALGYSVD
ncbi:MAG TPA: helix-turn-helix transcriptional regulator [Thermomicrobiales bacterium]|nr:helix-turn-helix transcriptional regulator [Thermomicrobiales bacterium]